MRLVSTRGSSPNLVNGPSSWNGSGLVVAKMEEGAPGVVWVGVYDDALQTLAEDRPVATDVRTIVALVWNGTEHGLFYTATTGGLLLQRLSPAGQPIGGPVSVTDKTVYFGDDIDVVWSDALNAYVVGRVITEGRFRGLWLTLVERSGAIRSDRQAPVSASSQSELDLAVTETGMIGAFFNNAAGSIAFAVTGAEGGIAVRALVPRSTFIAAVAQDGLFILTYAAPVENQPKTEIRWLVIDSAQQIVRPDARLIAPTGDAAWPLALISNGEELALAYIDAPRGIQNIDQEYRLRRFAIDGTTISDTRFSGEQVALSRGQSPYDFVWTGTSYISAPVHAGSDRLNSYLNRYCPLVADIVSPTRNVRIGENVVFSGNASGGVPGYEFFWNFSFESAQKRGQTIERVFDRTGTFQVTLSVVDASGAVSRETITVNVVRPRSRAVRH
ncbi:MAG TPA: PKD domain-containing protein [Thermoanaerobaculia bacterium]|nr:PKD domain-containing protein [Thermoanaerobaculia bacterium]